MAPFPHCNAEVLHAPGTCQYCDAYPDRQAAHAQSGTPFTPAEANGWHGNVAQPWRRPPPDRSSVTTTPGERCGVEQPRGWRCTRYTHPHNTPCASVPKWWNFADRWRYRNVGSAQR